MRKREREAAHAAAAAGPGGNFRMKKQVIRNISANLAMTAMTSLSWPYRSARTLVTVCSKLSKCAFLMGEHCGGTSSSIDMTMRLLRHARASKSHVAKVTTLR